MIALPIPAMDACCWIPFRMNSWIVSVMWLRRTVWQVSSQSYPYPRVVEISCPALMDIGPAITREWLDTVKRRLSDQFDFCPEMLTHNLAVNLSGGRIL